MQDGRFRLTVETQTRNFTLLQQYDVESVFTNGLRITIVGIYCSAQRQGMENYDIYLNMI